VEYFDYLVGIVTNVARYSREMKSGIVTAKPAFSRKKNVFSNKLDFDLRKKLVKCHIWRVAFCGAETWTLRIVDHKYV
jgi:hypothetical protein